MDTTARNPLATAGRILAGIAVTIAAGVHAFIWLIVAGFECDESCGGTSWHGTPGAWQWAALGLLGFASFVLAIAFAVALATRRRAYVSGGLFAAALTTAIAPWILD